jgi:hypothetical protein
LGFFARSRVGWKDGERKVKRESWLASVLKLKVEIQARRTWTSPAVGGAGSTHPSSFSSYFLTGGDPSSFSSYTSLTTPGDLASFVSSADAKTTIDVGRAALTLTGTAAMLLKLVVVKGGEGMDLAAA